MQEPNISDVVETWTSNLRPGQTFETDTSSKNPKLKNRNLWIMPIFFYKFPKNIVATTKLQFFRISGVYLTCVGCFLSTNTADQKHVDLPNFTKPYFCRPRQDLKPSRLRLEKWEVSRPRPHLETPSLPPCSEETNILCSKSNVHLCLNQWWSLETHICESWSRRLQVSILWMLQRNSLIKFLKFSDFCLLHLQVRNNQTISEKAINKKNSTQKLWRHSKQSFGKMLKFWNLESRIFWWSLGLQVSTRSPSGRLHSRLHQWSKQTQKLFQPLLPVMYFNCNCCAFSNTFRTCNKRWSGLFSAYFDKVRTIQKKDSYQF